MEDWITTPTCLTMRQKLSALAARYYSNLQWKPKAGDYYTTGRDDLELYQIVNISDGNVFTRYCNNKTDSVARWDEDGFTTKGFGPKRVWVPTWIVEAA